MPKGCVIPLCLCLFGFGLFFIVLGALGANSAEIGVGVIAGIVFVLVGIYSLGFLK